MIKYDLPDIGIQYKGVATTKTKTLQINDWTIINIPIHIDSINAREEVSKLINNICAIEIPTSLQCNLRCKYCYIRDPRLKNKKVSIDSVKKILINVKKRFPIFNPNNKKQKQKQHLTAWGAEPFHNIDTFELLYQFGHNVYGKNNYNIGLSTNGTVWNNKIQELLKKILLDNAMPQIQISLDGSKNIQDYYRPFNNGKGSFDAINNFTVNLDKLLQSMNMKKNYHFCSTIFLKDDNFIEHYIEAAEFFTEKNTWHYAPILPMRTSGEDLDNDIEIEKFIEAQKQMFLFIKNKIKEDPNTLVIDNYTSRLFGNINNKSLNAFPYCSAMNTQLGIDIDGSIYLCHGPITTPEYKPFLWFGNLFDGVISYKQLIRNIHYMYGSTWTKSKCVDCPLHNYPTGNICWSCAPHNLAVSSHPMVDRFNKCIAYARSFKYWLRIAKMIYTGRNIDHIPNSLMELSSIEIEKLPCLNKKINVVNSKMHFNIKYNGLIDNALIKTNLDCKDKIDRDYSNCLKTWWWNEDNYLNNIIQKNLKNEN